MFKRKYAKSLLIMMLMAALVFSECVITKAATKAFVDIPIDSSITKPIYWAAEHGIIKGFPDGAFHPDECCTREQFVMMLWRFCDTPSAEDETAFTDVPESRSTFRAIQWAGQQGIIKGFPDGTFHPEDTVTRRQAVVMLWRMAGKPKAGLQADFWDVNPAESTYNAIAWGSEAGIVKGYTDGRFEPEADCERQHIVIFLYRYARNILKQDVTVDFSEQRQNEYPPEYLNSVSFVNDYKNHNFISAGDGPGYEYCRFFTVKSSEELRRLVNNPVEKDKPWATLRDDIAELEYQDSWYDENELIVVIMNSPTLNTRPVADTVIYHDNNLYLNMHWDSPAMDADMVGTWILTFRAAKGTVMDDVIIRLS